MEDVPTVCVRTLVAVSDDAIQAVMAQLGGCKVVLHTSGAAGPIAHSYIAATGVLHPLQTFADERPSDLSRCTFAYGGDDAACEWALELIETLGAKPLRVASDKWAEYHAAAVFASNYQVTLLDAALELMSAAGIGAPEGLAAIEPLTRAAIDNVFRQGTTSALTGPVRRGDVTTVERHLAALAHADTATRELYVAAAMRTLPIAARAGTDPESISRLLMA